MLQEIQTILNGTFSGKENSSKWEKVLEIQRLSFQEFGFEYELDSTTEKYRSHKVIRPDGEVPLLLGEESLFPIPLDQNGIDRFIGVLGHVGNNLHKISPGIIDIQGRLNFDKTYITRLLHVPDGNIAYAFLYHFSDICASTYGLPHITVRPNLIPPKHNLDQMLEQQEIGNLFNPTCTTIPNWLTNHFTDCDFFHAQRSIPRDTIFPYSLDISLQPTDQLYAVI